jgi:hypothetical protein
MGGQMTEAVKNIFISHIHEDDRRVGPLKDLVKQSAVEVRDGSINSINPNNVENSDHIKSQVLAPRIQWSDVFVVLISQESRDSEWVNWEIEYAHELRKRIVGVWDYRSAERDIPDALEQYADAIVCCQGERIKDAVLGGLITRETPSCEQKPPRPVPRYSC